MITLLIFILSISFTSTAAKKKYSDVKDTDWYSEYIYKLSDLGIIDGYSSGKFGPADNVKVAQVIKMVILALGYGEMEYYKGYVEKAKGLGLVKSTEFPDKASLERNMTRGEIARIVIRALEYRGQKYPTNFDLYFSIIKDYEKIPKGLQEYVLKAYSLGIISGGPSGNFGANDNTSRAAASKIIINMMYPDMRTLPKTETDDAIRVNGYLIPKNTQLAINAQKDGNTELFVSISLFKSLEPQYKDLESILVSKFDKGKVKEVMDYIKIKKDRETKLNPKNFYIKEYEIYIGSGDGTVNVIVEKEGV